MPEEKYMRRAIELAKKGSGHVNPNPLVGAVIVKDGEIIGEGYHECYGQLHAERNAIANARKRGNNIEGSTIYVTLEPCCHYGKTPPCTEAIIEEKIARVVVGSDDPNPLVSGKGFKLLREKGIEVIPHFLKEECDAMNHVFFHYISTGTPYVAMKYAMTMDGKIACYTGDSKWVTGEESRAHVQTLRNHYKLWLESEQFLLMTRCSAVVSKVEETRFVLLQTAICGFRWILSLYEQRSNSLLS